MRYNKHIITGFVVLTVLTAVKHLNKSHFSLPAYSKFIIVIEQNM